MFQRVLKMFGDLETTLAVAGAIFLSAVFFYSTFATKGEAKDINDRVTRSNEFHNQQLKEAVDDFKAGQRETNSILMQMLMENRKK